MKSATAYLKALWSDWPARMVGPLSLVALFTPIVLPASAVNEYLGGGRLVWGLSFLCLLVAGYRTWLSEHRKRRAERLNPLFEDLRDLTELWERIRSTYRDSELVNFPLSGFDVKHWTEEHKQLCRLLTLTSTHARRCASCFADLEIRETLPFVAAVTGRAGPGSVDARIYTSLLSEHRAQLESHRARLGAV